MDKRTEEMAEFVCDKRCMYANDNDLTQEQLDSLCAGCKLNAYVENLNNQTEQENLKTIAHHYGYENQSRQLIEEMAELTVAINKLARMEKLADDSVAHCLDVIHCRKAVAEEIADVEIMLEQIKYLMMNQGLVDEYKDFKIVRQLKKIAESEG